MNWQLWRLRGLMSWRWFRSNRLQLLLALTGVITGVAAVVAVDAARQAVASSFSSGMLALQGRASHTVTATGSASISLQQYAQLRQQAGNLPLAPLSAFRLRHVDGDLLQVQAVDLISELQWAQLEDNDSATDTGAALTQIADSDMADWLAGAPLVLVSENLLARVEAGVLKVFTPASASLQPPAQPPEDTGATLALRVAGSLSAAAAPDDTVIMEQSLAARLRGSEAIDQVRVALTTQQAQSLTGQLPDGLQLQPVERGDSGMSAAFALNLQAMGLLALLMGVLLVYSTFRLLLLQREAQNRLRHLLGEQQAQHWLEMLLEALLLGVLGALFGWLAGLLLADLVLNWLQQTLSDLFSSTGFAARAMGWRSAALAALTGVGSSLLAMLPMLTRWWRGRHTGRQQHRFFLAQTLDLRVALALLLLLVAALLLWLQTSLLAALAALFAVTMAWLLLSQRLLMLLARALHALSSMRTPLLALASARLRDAIPKMTPALAALILALATIVGVSSMISSFRNSVIDWLQITLSAPVYLSNDGQTMPAELLQQIDRQPLVAATGWLHALPARLSTSPDDDMQLLLLDLPARGQGSYRMLDGVSVWTEQQADQRKQPGPDANPAIAVMAGETLARRQSLQVGQTLMLQVAGQTRRVSIVGVFQDYSAGSGRLIARRTHWPDAPELPTSLAVYLDQDQVETFRDWLQRKLDPASAVRMISAERVKAETLRIFDQTFLLTRALRWILALVAMVGVSGALLALQLERRQELRLLHQLGLSGGEQRRLLSFEALFLAILAMLLALPLGYLLGWLLTEIINLRAFGWHIDLTVLASHWLLMIAVALLAGLLAAGMAMLANRQQDAASGDLI